MPIPCNTNTHTLSLRFKVDKDASQKYINNWINFKNICESGNNKQIVKDWLSNCRINSNKDMPYLNRTEGGIGGSSNLIHKQIRFRSNQVYLIDNDIVLNIYNSDKEEWLLEELDDLIRAFIIIANTAICAECVKGCVEIESNEIESNEIDSNDVLCKKINLNKLQGIEAQVSNINTHLEKLEKLLLKLLDEKNKVSN